MLRIHRILACAAIAVAVWIGLLTTDLVPGHHTLLLLAPLIALVLFGLYALVKLLYGVATFRTVPEELEALQKDLVAARADLIRRGVLPKA
ncbi:hypothetical protein WJX72_004475 [[Myrmecia] bisecta]|uniref:Dolichol-phosphate mannosyltransferase subunit 3 n=1 Tax=[Myrmecia] bisecta TaxID=41462 RepID=A0AAW1P342_9CHLO